MKIFCYHSGSNGTSLYRIWQPYKFLGQMDGFSVKRLPDHADRVHIPVSGECNVPGIGSHEEITAKNDVLVSQMQGAYEHSARMVCQAKMKPLILDLDDDILSLDRSNPNYQTWHRFDGKPELIMDIPYGEENSETWKENAKKWGAVIIQRGDKWFLVGHSMNFVKNVIEEIKAAALVTVSTKRLAEVYSRFNENVLVVPNSIDFDWWPANNRKNDGFIRLGLFGSNTHFKDWQEIGEVLVKILAEFPNVKLCYNSWFKITEAKQGGTLAEQKKTPQFPDYFDKLGLIEHPQVEIYEGVDIQLWSKALSNVGIDIGLAPLASTTFNRAKSNLKYLEFSALKIPGVYEKLDPYQDDVKHGVNGLLASHPADWYSCIKRLIEDESMRRLMGNRAYADVKERYDQKNISAKLGAHIEQLTASRLILSRS